MNCNIKPKVLLPDSFGIILQYRSLSVLYYNPIYEIGVLQYQNRYGIIASQTKGGFKMETQEIIKQLLEMSFDMDYMDIFVAILIIFGIYSGQANQK